MVNYNDGNWHGWNGGECPVHPKSVIDVVLINSFGMLIRDERDAGINIWQSDQLDRGTLAFRVIKEHKEPREYWINTNAAATATPHKGLDKWYAEMGYIRVREVTP